MVMKQQQPKLRYVNRKLGISNAGANTSERKRKLSLNIHVLAGCLVVIFMFTIIVYSVSRNSEAFKGRPL